MAPILDAVPLVVIFPRIRLFDEMFNGDINLLVDDPLVDAQDNGRLDENMVTNFTS